MVGLLGHKIGMTQVFNEYDELLPVTVIQIKPNTVIAKREVAKNGYAATVLASGDLKETRASKPYAGQFPTGISPKKNIFELRGFAEDANIGDSFGVELFSDISFVDVSSISKGKGFQGVMKRHGFGGGRKTHGSKFHRDIGSTGQAAQPSRVVKGTKMAGRMGAERVTVQNLEVVKVDTEKQFILVGGSVPGPKGVSVFVCNAKKKR